MFTYFSVVFHILNYVVSTSIKIMFIFYILMLEHLRKLKN